MSRKPEPRSEYFDCPPPKSKSKSTNRVKITSYAEVGYSNAPPQEWRHDPLINFEHYLNDAKCTPKYDH